ncbi:hypothetical protein BH23BAC4_BH23BAC4_02450 [soil metagenome]
MDRATGNLHPLATRALDRFGQGEVFHLPGLGALSRVHIPSHVEETDRGRALAPPRDEVHFDSSLASGEADDAGDAAPVIRAIQGALRATGVAKIEGFGIFRRTDEGVDFYPAPSLAEAANLRFSGLRTIALGGASPPPQPPPSRPPEELDDLDAPVGLDTPVASLPPLGTFVASDEPLEDFAVPAYTDTLDRDQAEPANQEDDFKSEEESPEEDEVLQDDPLDDFEREGQRDDDTTAAEDDYDDEDLLDGVWTPSSKRPEDDLLGPAPDRFEDAEFDLVPHESSTEDDADQDSSDTADGPDDEDVHTSVDWGNPTGETGGLDDVSGEEEIDQDPEQQERARPLGFVFLDDDDDEEEDDASRDADHDADDENVLFSDNPDEFAAFSAEDDDEQAVLFDDLDDDLEDGDELLDEPARDDYELTWDSLDDENTDVDALSDPDTTDDKNDLLVSAPLFTSDEDHFEDDETELTESHLQSEIDSFDDFDRVTDGDEQAVDASEDEAHILAEDEPYAAPAENPPANDELPFPSRAEDRSAMPAAFAATSSGDPEPPATRRIWIWPLAFVLVVGVAVAGWLYWTSRVDTPAGPAPTSPAADTTLALFPGTTGEPDAVDQPDADATEEPMPLEDPDRPAHPDSVVTGSFPEPLRSDTGIDPRRDGFTWVLGSTPNRAGAERDVARYRRQGYRSDLLPITIRGSQTYRIAVGQWGSVYEARDAVDELPRGEKWLLRLRTSDPIP